MPRRPEVVDFLRAEGLNVIEVDGWSERGYTTFNPKGSVNHHTAGPAVGNHPSLKTLINGRGGANPVPGPLCNVSLARNLDVYMIAAGSANHAGVGGFKGLNHNRDVWGLEVEHTGVLATEPPPSPEKMEVMYKIHAAFAKSSGFDAKTVCQHFEWAPKRKIDFIGVNPDAFRFSVQRIIDSDSGDDDMSSPTHMLVWSAGHNGDTTTWVTDLVTKVKCLPGQPDILKFFNKASVVENYPEPGKWVPHNFTPEQINAIPTWEPSGGSSGGNGLTVEEVIQVLNKQRIVVT